jgi:hypothetical protein
MLVSIGLVSLLLATLEHAKISGGSATKSQLPPELRQRLFCPKLLIACESRVNPPR